jgi:peptidylprolyl isomerase
MKKTSIIIPIVIFVFIAAAVIWYFVRPAEAPVEVKSINSFEECVAAGNPVMESYPRQCRTEDGRLFVEDIGNELEKADLITIDNPRPNQEIESPLAVRGEARGYWFFEASFPVILTDWDGMIIAQGIAQAQDDWMTEDFVPFEATLEFEVPDYNNKGTLILKKDNPSGLPENDDALEIPIIFKQKNMTALIKTNKGDIKIELFSQDAPNTVANFVKLAEQGFYDNTKFHRVIKDFMIQGGDPLSKDDSKKSLWGRGGPGYAFADEIGPNNHNYAGTIAMANSGPDTNGSQFFINTVDNNYLDSKHTVFGKVVEGMDVVYAIDSVATEGRDRPVEDIIVQTIMIQK